MRCSLVFAAATMAVGLPAAEAEASFCTRYAQTWSNAGQCADCRLKVAADARSQTYAVEASNGWTASLSIPTGQGAVAAGAGIWKSGLGHIYSGHRFAILLSQQDRVLSMVMTAQIGGKAQVVRARFRCLDTDPRDTL